jgi:hypothetical protein
MTSIAMQKIPLTAWIPYHIKSCFKCTIVSGSQETDLTSYLDSVSVEPKLLPEVGRFDIEFYNPDEKFTGLFTYGDKIHWYKDYGDTATTLRNVGIIESVDYTNFMIRIKGKLQATNLMDINVSGAYRGDAGLAVKDIISKVNLELESPYDHSHISEIGVDIIKDISDIPANEAIADICELCGYEAYVDVNRSVQFFETRSVRNELDAIAEGYNVINVSDFYEDTSLVRNRIKVIGATINDVPILYTANDLASQEYYRRVIEETITDSNITSLAEAKNLAEAHLLLKKDAPIVGEIESLLLPNLAPGQMLRVSVPSHNIGPAFYRVVSFQDKYSDDSYPSTTVKLEKWSPSISQEIRKALVTARPQSDVINPNMYHQSHQYLFDSNEDLNLTECISAELSEGQLIFTSDTGVAVTGSINLTKNPTKLEIRASGENVALANYSISLDGTNYSPITLSELYTDIPPGTNLSVKIATTSTAVVLDSLGVLWA